MVEFKRMIAQDASAIGQLLEESDLTDSALTARLNEDLRTRVLATRLLQKYGYLLPKINPESELGQEQKLVLQERAQQLVRASERGYEGREPPAAGINAACDLEQQSGGCDAQGRFWQKTRTLSEPRGGEALPAKQNPPREEYPMQPSRPENASSPQILRTGATEQNAGEYQQASSSAMDLGGLDGAFPQVMSGNEMPSSGNSPGERSMNAGGPRSNADAFERRYAGRGAGDKPFAEIESVRMVHRPNPYADAPSLYDLYVQATWPAQGVATRFGADVFRRGGVNVEVLPMDLPVGPDYVLGPGDSLSIDLWGGVSQRLFRVVDREGRLRLPEAGPLLVSGKSLGEVQEAVQRVLRTQFRDVSADVSLLKLRTIRIYVVGEVSAPGAYDISSLSTPLNALFAAGGVTGEGIAAPAGTLPREAAGGRSGCV